MNALCKDQWSIYFFYGKILLITGQSKFIMYKAIGNKGTPQIITYLVYKNSKITTIIKIVRY